MTQSDDDFLSRWSRRKVEARGGLRKKVEERPRGRMITDPLPKKRTTEEEDGDCRPGGVETAGAAPELAGGSSEETAGKGQLASTQSVHEAPPQAEGEDPPIESIDIDALTFESDYTRFMKDNVPEAIRRRALRHLWQSDPVLANIDGLNDYDEDFTDAALVVKALSTSHRVGQGFMTDEEVADLKGEDLRKPDDADTVADADADAERVETSAHTGSGSQDEPEGSEKPRSEHDARVASPASRTDDEDDDVGEGDSEFA